MKCSPTSFLFACVFLFAGLPAQDKIAGPDAFALVAEAEKLVEAKKLDEATMKLIDAFDASRNIDSDVVRGRFEAMYLALIKKADPLRAERAAARTKTSELVTALALLYQRRRWYKTAIDLLEYATEYDPEPPKKALKYSKKKLAAMVAKAPKLAPKPVEKKQSEDLIARMNTRFAHGDGWYFGKDEVRTPLLRDGSTVYCISSIENRDHRIRVDMKMADAKGGAALMFGAKGSGDYFLLELLHFKSPQDSVLRISDYSGGNMVMTVAETSLSLTSAAKNDYLTLEVRIKGNQISAAVSGKAILRHTARREPHGNLGLFVAGNGAYKLPISFRRLRLDPCESLDFSAKKKEVVVDEKQVLQKSIWDRVAAAEALLKSKKLEAAATECRELMFESWRVDSSLIRANLQAAITELTRKADVSYDKRDTVRDGVTDLWLGLVTAYEKREYLNTAITMLSTARRFNRQTSDKRYKEFEKAHKSFIEEIGGILAEADRPVSNVELREWMSGGREHFSTGKAIDEDGLHAPRQKVEISWLLEAKKNSGSVRGASVQILCGAKKASVGLVFGLRGSSRFHVALMRHNGRASTVSISRWSGREWGTLVTKKVFFSRLARKQWMTVSVEYDAQGIRAKFGNAPAIEVKLENPIKYGRLGLYMWRPKDAGKVSFRNLIVSEQPVK